MRSIGKWFGGVSGWVAAGILANAMPGDAFYRNTERTELSARQYAKTAGLAETHGCKSPVRRVKVSQHVADDGTSWWVSCGEGQLFPMAKRHWRAFRALAQCLPPDGEILRINTWQTVDSMDVATWHQQCSYRASAALADVPEGATILGPVE